MMSVGKQEKIQDIKKDIENNPHLTEEQKEEIIKQEEISREITNEIDYAINSNDKGGDFEEIKGILSKKNKLGKWKEWYFCIVSGNLCYYESEKLNKKEGDVEIGKIKSVGVIASKKKKNKGKKFSINHDKGHLVLKAKNEEESQKWVSYLNYVIQMNQINNI